MKSAFRTPKKNKDKIYTHIPTTQTTMSRDPRFQKSEFNQNSLLFSPRDSEIQPNTKTIINSDKLILRKNLAHPGRGI